MKGSATEARISTLAATMAGGDLPTADQARRQRRMNVLQEVARETVLAEAVPQFDLRPGETVTDCYEGWPADEMPLTSDPHLIT